jgi:hypothetical protein
MALPVAGQQEERPCLELPPSQEKATLHPEDEESPSESGLYGSSMEIAFFRMKRMSRAQPNAHDAHRCRSE